MYVACEESGTTAFSPFRVILFSGTSSSLTGKNGTMSGGSARLCSCQPSRMNLASLCMAASASVTLYLCGSWRRDWEVSRQLERDFRDGDQQLMVCFNSHFKSWNVLQKRKEKQRGVPFQFEHTYFCV